jgi:hypothetical protein
MVDAFIRKQSNFVQGFIDELLFAPVDVPVVVFGLAVSPPGHGLLDAIGEESFEFDIATRSGREY